MYPYTNTRSGPTTSTKTTKTVPLDSSYVTQTDFSITSKYLLANFDDKFKESIKETIAYQYSKFDKNNQKTATGIVTPDQRGFYKVFIKNGWSEK